MDAVNAVLSVARASRATDVATCRPRRMELLHRAHSWSQEAEDAAATLLVAHGHGLEHPAAPLVCATVQYGITRGRAAKVAGLAPWVGYSRRHVSMKLGEAVGMPALRVLTLGIVIRLAHELAASQARGSCQRAAYATGFGTAAEGSNFLWRAIRARPSRLTETCPVALAARFAETQGTLSG
jgi:hypothetical protein